jgi:hypothetical protein
VRILALDQARGFRRVILPAAVGARLCARSPTLRLCSQTDLCDPRVEAARTELEGESAESSSWISDIAKRYSRAIWSNRARHAVVSALRASSKQQSAKPSNCLSKVAVIARKQCGRSKESSEDFALAQSYSASGFRAVAAGFLNLSLGTPEEVGDYLATRRDHTVAKTAGEKTVPEHPRRHPKSPGRSKSSLRKSRRSPRAKSVELGCLLSR